MLRTTCNVINFISLFVILSSCFGAVGLTNEFLHTHQVLYGVTIIGIPILGAFFTSKLLRKKTPIWTAVLPILAVVSYILSTSYFYDWRAKNISINQIEQM